MGMSAQRSMAPVVVAASTATWVVMGVLALAPGNALADSSTVVFPIATSKAPGDLTRTSNKVTEELSDVLEARISELRIADATLLLDCDVETTRCLERVAKSVKAKRLIFGTITRTDRDEDESSGEFRVSITRFDVGGDLARRTFELPEQPAGEFARAVVAAAQPLWRGRADEPTEPDRGDLMNPAAATDSAGAADVDPTPAAPETTLEDHASPPSPGITSGTWALLGGGAVVTGIGVGLWVSTGRLRADIEAHPRETAADLMDLEQLENRGRRRTQISAGLMAVGSAAMVIAAVRGVVQHREAKSNRRSLVVQPVPIEHGAAVIATWSVP